MEKYMFIQEGNFEKSRKKIRENSKKRIIFSSKDDELNRKILEKEKINVLLLNQSQRRDRPKQRGSGLNHVLAKIAKKKGVDIGINLDEILQAKGKEKSNILARIRQNIKLCNKNKLNMKLLSPEENKRNDYDLKSLGLVLGMPTWMTNSL